MTIARESRAARARAQAHRQWVAEKFGVDPVRLAERSAERLVGLLEELVSSLGHDPQDPQVRKVIAATCRNYAP